MNSFTPLHFAWFNRNDLLFFTIKEEKIERFSHKLNAAILNKTSLILIKKVLLNLKITL